MGIKNLRKLGDGYFGVALSTKELRQEGLVDGDGERVNEDQLMNITWEGNGCWTVEALGSETVEETPAAAD